MNNYKHPAHREIKDAMKEGIGHIFLRNLYNHSNSLIFFERTPSYRLCYRTIEEYPITRPNGTDRTGKKCCSTKFIDFIYLVEPDHSSIYNNACFSIAVEIKNSKSDLKNAPHQFNDYYGVTDFSMLAVPNYLLRDAKRIVDGIPWVGIFSYETGEIIKIPSRMPVSDGTRIMMLRRVVFCLNQEIKKEVILFSREVEA